ncbi:hypothetical protein TNCV_256231 [Trichonephila clavipes]|nr:hypothetical protein TNCV_256231 [Trichonephila clavipes]
MIAFAERSNIYGPPAIHAETARYLIAGIFGTQAYYEVSRSWQLIGCCCYVVVTDAIGSATARSRRLEIHNGKGLSDVCRQP